MRPPVKTLVEASKALVEADDIDMNCGWDSPSCHFCLEDTYSRNGGPHADDCPWAAFKEALHAATS
jgi:hypothetical protein